MRSRLTRESVQVREYRVYNKFRGLVPCVPQYLGCAAVILLAIRALLFRNTVGTDDHQIVRLHFQRGFVIFPLLQKTQRHSTQIQPADLAIPAEEWPIRTGA